MEILILGIILVALMAYVSTKIKKSAAQAFEREAIEAEDFRIVKPEGFLNFVSSENPENAFEAYSKDFGEGEASEYRKVIVKVHKTDGQSENLPPESEETKKDVTFQTFRKTLKNNGKAYELEISALKDYRDEYLDKINEMLNSFSLK